jgi:hypothetical protein
MKIRVCASTIIFAMLLAASVLSCGDLDNDYSGAPGLHLSFSTDTLRFDTVFADIGSPTLGFMVYNRNSSALLIQSIRLTDDTYGAFRINVDGRRAQSFENVRIGARDSMYVLAEVTAPESGNDAPVLIESKMEFVVNGSRQQVVLSACGQDVYMLKGGIFVEADTVWTSARPYLVYDSLVIDSGVRLRIEAGAVLYMHNKAAIIVNGSLSIDGSLDKPVSIRGDRLDGPAINITYDRISGQWDGIRFGANSFDNELNHVSIRNGYSGIVCLPSEPSRSKLRIANAQVANMRTSVLEAVNCKIEAVNSEFANAEGRVVSLTGGEANFVHCTIANYYIFTPGRTPGTPVLLLANHIYNMEGATTDYPLIRANFDNCIIDGNNAAGKSAWSGEIYVERKEDVELNIKFNHCALKTFEADDDAFANVRFISNQSPLYQQTGDSDNGYTFDFRPAPCLDRQGKPLEKQPIIAQADTAVARLCPTDRYGLARINESGAADIGAYVFVPKVEEE